MSKTLVKVNKAANSIIADRRRQTMAQQMVERVETLCDVMTVLKVKDLNDITGRSGKVLQGVAKDHRIKVTTLYRWLREYRDNNGISLHIRGRS